MKDEYVNMLDALLVDLRRQLLQETDPAYLFFSFDSCVVENPGLVSVFFGGSNGLKAQVYVVDDDGGGADITAGTVYHITWD